MREAWPTESASRVVPSRDIGKEGRVEVEHEERRHGSTTYNDIEMGERKQLIYVTADTHFGHEGIIDFCGRPFSDVEEMDREMLTKINEIVTPKDVLYILGDFTHKSRSKIHPRVYRKLIKAKEVHLVLGNHDRQKDCLMAGFDSVTWAAHIKFNHHHIVLSHFPMTNLPKSWINLHGHTHGTHDQTYQCLDVGVDALGALSYPSRGARKGIRTTHSPLLIEDMVELSKTIKEADKGMAN